MRKDEINSFRDRAARPTLERIRADLERVSQRLKPVLEVLWESLFHSDLDVSFLWRESGIRNKNASEWFTAELEQTPLAYLTDCRLRVGAVFLVETDLRVWKIAECLGYANSDAFGRSFKSWSEVSPGKFRRDPDRKLPRLPDPAGAGEPEGRDRAVRPVRSAVVSFYEDTAYAAALCDPCRRSFRSDDGRAVADRLRRALDPFPADLAWLAACCDDCYRVVWDAVARARLGLLDDAGAAWLLSQSAHARDDPGTPPSLGRVVRLLVESEKLAFSDPERRLKLCRRASETAADVPVPGLVTVTLLYEGNALRALNRYDEGRKKLHEAHRTGWQGARGARWIAAAYYHRLGALEADAESYGEAVRALRTGVERYRELDGHLAALCKLKLAEALYWSGQFEEALATLEDAVAGMDLRRLVQLPASIANNRGLYLCAVGRLDEAEEELRKFQSDESVLLACHEHMMGCLRMEQERPVEALPHLSRSKDTHLDLEKTEEAAQVVLYVAECRAQTGDFSMAREELEAAIRLFAMTGRHARVLQGLQQLKGVLEKSKSVDAAVVAIRRTAWASGGCLPVTPRLRQR